MTRPARPTPMADLTWDLPSETVHHAPKPSGEPLAELLASLAATRKRCRSVSERVIDRVTSETLPHLRRASGSLATGVRPPEPGTTDVVELRPVLSPPIPRRKAAR